MKSALHFLIAARQCEIDDLEHLADTSELALTLGQLIHTLQRERGASNMFVASAGQRFGAERPQMVAASDLALARTHARFAQLLTPAARAVGSRTRLFSSIAHALHGIEDLPQLRARVASREIDTQGTIDAYAQLIASLLAVVFEAADSASNPEVSKLLVAYFSFMQGKEHAGQERAVGTAAFASGLAAPALQQQILTLIDAQERCLQTFGDLAAAAAQQRWQECQSSLDLAELERLRRRVCTSSPLDTELSLRWFGTCSQRIDAMKHVEDFLASQLRQLCQDIIGQARQDLLTHERLLQTPATPAPAPWQAAALPHPHRHPNATTPVTASPYGPQLDRAILGMLHEQTERMQAMGDELAGVRATLHERKLIERAKGLLMAHRQLSEEAAYRMLRQTAMAQSRRLVEVAESVLALQGYLGGDNQVGTGAGASTPSAAAAPGRAR